MKTVYEKLTPTQQRIYDERIRGMLGGAAITHDGGVTWTNPQDKDVLWQKPSLTAINPFNSSLGQNTISPTSSPLTWDMDSRQAKWNKCKDKTVVDIGVIANGACVTFDDSSMLEITPSNNTNNLIEKSDLNLLNGTQLDDIVVIPQHSLVSDWIGNLVICGKNGAQVVFKIYSPSSSTNFFFDLKDLNAIRQQTTPV